MSNARGDPKRKKGAGRDGGGFIALPWAVLDSDAYRGLSHTAKALLLEVARQFHGSDNGRMLMSGKYLATRGWHSPDVIVRAKRELLNAELIFETVKGCRPNKASWYAVTWLTLDRIPGFDLGVEKVFERGAYRKTTSPQPISKIAALTTAGVVERALTATSRVVEASPPTTAAVAMGRISDPPPTTAAVHPLDTPSVGVARAVGAALAGDDHKRPRRLKVAP